MNVHQWADWAVIAQAVLAFAAALVAYWQITAAAGRKQEVEDPGSLRPYETEPIASSVVRLRHLYSPDLYSEQELSCRSPGLFCLVDDARLVLNYLARWHCDRREAGVVHRKFGQRPLSNYRYNSHN
jgi:hypothetical protein